MSTMTLNPTRELGTVRDLRPTRPVVPQQQRSVEGDVRLTRRGRLVVFIASLLFVLAAGIFLGAQSVATNEAGAPVPTEVVMVGEGETLWGIAAEIADDGEIRDVMSEIKRLNGLDSAMLSAGQKLRIPLTD